VSRWLDFLIPADVRAVRDSLDCGDDWKPWYIGGRLYHLTHVETGLYLWTQNRAYGLEIHNRDSVTLYGGVTILSSFGLSIGRWSLFFAIRRWERKHPAPPRPAKLPAAQVLQGAAQGGER
jgi:hypothetical protein